MKHIKLTYLDDSVVYLKLELLLALEPDVDGSKLYVGSTFGTHRVVYVKETPEQIYASKIYELN